MKQKPFSEIFLFLFLSDIFLFQQFNGSISSDAFLFSLSLSLLVLVSIFFFFSGLHDLVHQSCFQSSLDLYCLFVTVGSLEDVICSPLALGFFDLILIQSDFFKYSKIKSSRKSAPGESRLETPVGTCHVHSLAGNIREERIDADTHWFDVFSRRND